MPSPSPDAENGRILEARRKFHRNLSEVIPAAALELLLDSGETPAEKGRLYGVLSMAEKFACFIAESGSIPRRLSTLSADGLPVEFAYDDERRLAFKSSLRESAGDRIIEWEVRTDILGPAEGLRLFFEVGDNRVLPDRESFLGDDIPERPNRDITDLSLHEAEQLLDFLEQVTAEEAVLEGNSAAVPGAPDWYEKVPAEGGNLIAGTAAPSSLRAVVRVTLSPEMGLIPTESYFRLTNDHTNHSSAGFTCTIFPLGDLVTVEYKDRLRPALEGIVAWERPVTEGDVRGVGEIFYPLLKRLQDQWMADPGS